MCHGFIAKFDDPNLVSCAGLAPVLELAERAGVQDLVAEHVRSERFHYGWPVPDYAALSRHGRTVDSVFDLLGRDENALTAALGFALARSAEFRSKLLTLLLPNASSADEVVVRMETRDALGRTDLEVQSGSQLAVVEAKRGWLLPERQQLQA